MVSSIMDRHLASSFGDLQPWKGEPGEEKLGGINRSAMEASKLEAELCETRLAIVKETDQSKLKTLLKFRLNLGLKDADLKMELKHEWKIKRQAKDSFNVEIKVKDLEIAMLTQERVKKIKRDWWLWGTVATARTIGATSLAYSNPSGNFDGDKYVAIFKPVDEEPYVVNNPKGYTEPLREENVGVKIITTIGGGAIREVAAYLLHHPLRGPCNNPDNIGFAGVAPTVMIRCRLYNDFNHGGGEEIKKMKVGSLLMYHPNVRYCEDMGTSGFRVHGLHKISSSPTNGNFNVFWDTDNLGASQVSDIKNAHSNVKVGLSLGGDSVNSGSCYFNPSSVDSWVSNAVSSLTSIIQQYNLDGIDIDYEHFQSDPDTFSECIGRLIKTLKDNGVIKFASIAPFDDDDVQSHYLALWKNYGQLIDYVNFQFYAYDQSTTVSQFIDYFKTQSSNYIGGKVLASFSTDGSGGLSPENGFFTACNRLKSEQNLNGIFVWSADDSKKNGFRYEKQSQALLAIPH
ncbi:hypothetical protein ACLB2K_026853 [Fragaria x ananassa]